MISSPSRKNLSKVPDQPAVPGFKPGSHDLYGKPSNSIIDWIHTDNIQYDDHSISYTDYECDQYIFDFGNAEISVFCTQN